MFVAITEVISIGRREKEMSGYENVIGGKLKLKGKALDVKAGGVKKKKKQKKQHDQISEAVESECSAILCLCTLQFDASLCLCIC